MYSHLVSSEMRSFAKIRDLVRALNAIFDPETAQDAMDQETIEDFILRQMNLEVAGPVYRCFQTILREFRELEIS